MVTYTFENSSNRDEATNISPLLTSATDIFHVGYTPGTSSSVTNVDTGTVNGGTASMGTAEGTQRQANYTSNSATFNRNEYMSFTLTPGAGGIELDSISFDFSRAGSGSRFFVLEYSFDGFTTPLSLGSGTNGVSNEYTRATFNLNNTLTTSPVEFRFFGYREGNTTAAMRFDNIQVTAIPEPSTLALLGLAGLAGLVGFKRRNL
ncbi:MAG: PEP-CTERM sorting domain-containing protein [Kiritimatiellae bacterium]|nr:PEP-CTERM sorting domain-containing protein [Kiritimatiellia bacterium]